MKTKLLFTFIHSEICSFTGKIFSCLKFRRIIVAFHVASFFFLSFIFTYSQAPESFNYQAVARDNAGQVLKSQALYVKIRILSGGATGTLQWEEIHEVATNEFGLFAIQIGTELKTDGETAEFSAIDWNSTTHFLNVQVDAGNDYVEMGTTQLLSVPYALSASSVSDLKKLNILGPSDQPADLALFEVKNKDGNIVFAVYNEGVRVYVSDDDGKGLKGGFAVGGFSSSKGITDEFFRVTPDSVRIYVDTATAKGLKGGFAVGGYSSSKGLANEYLRVTPDSVRIYINESMAKGRKGGFAVGGFSSSKGTVTDFMHLTPDNYFIGHESGSSITTGLYNSFIGYKAGVSTTIGNSNVFIGHESGLKNLDGEWNVFIGNNTGQNNTTGWSNIFVGDGSGEFNTEGTENVMMGDWAGRNNTDGSSNVIIGGYAGYSNTTGEGNVYLGYEAGSSNSIGGNNIAIGPVSGYSNTDSNNVFVGCAAGYYNINGKNNVFIGYEAGINETGSNKLYIDNSGALADDALIYGDFSLEYLNFDAYVDITYDLHVDGDVTATGFIEPSDIRWKTNIAAYENALDKLMQIRGVNFEWKSKEAGHWKFPDGNQLGVIAQEVEKVIPELVKTNEEGYKLVDYTKLSVILVQAVKEQQRMIDKLEKDNTNLKTEMERIDDLQDQIDQLKNMLSK